MHYSSEEVFKDLSPFFIKFIECIQEANKEQLEAISPEARAKIKKRTVSGFMNDIISHNIRETFTGEAGFNIEEKYGQTRLNLSSKYLIKFKKSSNKKIGYIPTQSALNFLYQLDRMQLPGMPTPITNLFLVYEWNKTRTQVTNISILCPNGRDKYSWELPISHVPMPLFSDIPLESSSIEDIPKPKRVRPKHPKTQPQKGTKKNNGKQGTIN